MITSRYATFDDYNMLANSLLRDDYHKATDVGFFYEEGTVCSIFEDDHGPVLFVRGKPIVKEGVGIIQLDIQFLNNEDAKRNMRTMLEGFPILENRAKEAGFAGFIFQSTAPFLRKFCIRRLGFIDYNEEFLVKVLLEDSLDKRVEGGVQ